MSSKEKKLASELLHGGRIRRRDLHFGLPAEFWHWWHRDAKARQGFGDLRTRADAIRVYNEWVSFGKPRPK